MEPGRTYVAVLPGRKKPAFVRKRVELPSPLDLGLTALRRAWGPSQQRSHTADQVQRKVRVYSAPEPQYFMAPPPQQQLQLQYPSSPQQTVVTEQAVTRYPTQPSLPQPLVEAPNHVSETISTKVVTRNDDNMEVIGKHTCASCGKYRSPNYQSRHPLAPGEVPRPSFCRRCIKEHTSSEDSQDEGYRRRRSHHRDKYHKKRRHGRRRPVRTDSTEENQRSSSSQDNVHRVQRSRSISRSSRRHYRSRSSSSSHVSTLYRPVGLLKGKPRSSDERIKVVERTRYVDRLAQPLPRSRSREAIPRQSSRHKWLLDRQRSEHDHTRTYSRSEIRRPLSPYRAIEYGYDDDHHEDYYTTRLVPGRHSRSMLARHVMPYELQREHYVQSIPEPYPEHVIQDDRFDGRSYDYDPNFDEAPHLPSRSVRVIRVTEDSDDQLQRREWDRGRPETTNRREPFSVKASYQRPRSQEAIVGSVNSPKRPGRRRYKGRDVSSDDSSRDELYPPGVTNSFKWYRAIWLIVTCRTTFTSSRLSRSQPPFRTIPTTGATFTVEPSWTLLRSSCPWYTTRNPLYSPAFTYLPT